MVRKEGIGIMSFYTDEQLSIILSTFEAMSDECIFVTTAENGSNEWWDHTSNMSLWLDCTIGELGYNVFDPVKLLRQLEKIGLA